jgi:hypothetical protein
MPLKMGVSKMCITIACNHDVTRRGALKAAAGFALAAGVDRASAREGDAEQPKPNAIGADTALRRLMEGNARYVANKPAHRVFRRTRGAGEIAISDCRGPERIRALPRNLRSTKDPAIFLSSGSPAISPMTMDLPVSNMR